MGFFSRDSKVKKLVKAGKSGELVEQHLQGEVVVPEIISLLEDKHEGVRSIAASAIGDIGLVDPEAVRAAIPRLISLLEDKDKHVRDNAALALGKIGAVEALEPLGKLLSDGPEVYIGEGKTTVGEVAREAIERIGKTHYQGSA